MNNGKILKVFIVIVLILCFMLLGFIWYTYRNLLEKQQVDISNEVMVNTEPQTLEEALDKNDVEVTQTGNNNVIYVVFPKDLYDEEGNSNEDFFYSFIDSIEKYFDKNNFILIDYKNDIRIDADYDKIDEKYVLTINGIKDYYKSTEGNVYAKLKENKIKDSNKIPTDNRYLYKLSGKNSYFSAIENELVEDDITLSNGYRSFEKGAIRVRISPVGTVRNIIFSDSYDGKINSNIDMHTSLEDILKKYPKNAFGNLKDGYLGYISDDFYYFFYTNEISVYSYSYGDNKQFELLLDKYLETKDLGNFISSIEKLYKTYDYLEYDPEIQKAKVLFSTRGIEIDIEENDPKGITLYSNYKISSKTKKYVEEGTITINSKEDLVHKVEKARREGK